MLNQLFGKGLPALEETQVALRTPAGKVPAEHYAAVLGADGLFTLYSSGETYSLGKGEQAWLLRAGPHRVSFAPNPQAPEAGVEAVLQWQLDDERLALLLQRQDADQISIEMLAELARQHGGEQLLLPGMLQSEIDATGGVRARFSNRLAADGLRCTALRRVDLADKVSTAERLWQQLQWPEQVETPETEQATESPRPIPEKIRKQAETAVALGYDFKPRFWWSLETMDNKLRENLSRELAYLMRRIMQLKRHPALSREQFQQLHDWETRLHTLSLSVSALPVLNSKFPGLELSEMEQTRRFVEVRHSMEGLNRVKSLLGSDPETLDWPRLEVEMPRQIAAWKQALRYRAGLMQEENEQ